MTLLACAIHIALSFIYLIPSSLYLLIPNPYLAPPPFPLSVGNH